MLQVKFRSFDYAKDLAPLFDYRKKIRFFFLTAFKYIISRCLKDGFQISLHIMSTTISL